MSSTGPLTENEIIDNAYGILEQDNAGWDTDSAEYLTARILLEGAINRWELYDNVHWSDLWVSLDDATTDISSNPLVKTTTVSDYDYLAPGDMRYPASWVRTVASDGTVTLWQVVRPAQSVIVSDGNTATVCWFTGNISIGFTLHFNPNRVLTTGDTIKYEYFRMATKPSATTTKFEMQDAWFAAYYIAAHMADGGLDTDYMNMAEVRLEQMKTANTASLELMPDNVPDNLAHEGGFGV